MNDPKQEVELIKKITIDWANKGRLIEGGWQAYLLGAIPADAPEIHKSEMRKAYYCGAQHLFASLMVAMDPGQDPTESDVDKMRLISDELEKFVEEHDKANK